MITSVTSLPTWAERNGISRARAYRLFHAGKLPVPARQLANGRIVVDISPPECQGACLTDLHIECLTDAVLIELARRGIHLDPQPTTGDDEGNTATPGSL